MKEVRETVRKRREEEVVNQIRDITSKLNEEGYIVQFGNIGKKTTYAMIFNPNTDEEFVGYTFVMNMKYYNENIGKLKSLCQAMARKETLQLSEN